MTTSDFQPGCLRPEIELVLCCARTHLGSGEAERLKTLLRSNIDWDYLLRWASLHSLDPLLYWHLKTNYTEHVPKESLDTLRCSFFATAAQGLLLTRELFRVLDSLSAANIPAVPFKGLLLASAVYKNLALRKLVDLDILIHPQDLSRALDLLFSLGYRKQLADGSGVRFRQGGRQCALVCEESGSVVDLHWGLTPGFFSLKSYPEGTWTRLQPVSFNGRQILTFSSEDLLVMLCIHGSKHLWSELRWLCDVAELIRTHSTMDWQKVMHHAATAGSERMLLLGLSLARDLLGAPLPQCVVLAVQADPTAQSIARKLRVHLIQNADRPIREFKRALLHLRIIESQQDRIRYSMSRLTAPTEAEWETVKLPRLFQSLYCFLRPVRLVGKYGQEVLMDVFQP